MTDFNVELGSNGRIGVVGFMPRVPDFGSVVHEACAQHDLPLPLSASTTRNSGEQSYDVSFGNPYSQALLEVDPALTDPHGPLWKVAHGVANILRGRGHVVVITPLVKDTAGGNQIFPTQ